MVEAEEVHSLATVSQLHDPGLGVLRLPTEIGEQNPQPRKRRDGLPLGPAQHHQVIDVPHQRPVRAAPCPVEPVQEDVDVHILKHPLWVEYPPTLTWAWISSGTCGPPASGPLNDLEEGDKVVCVSGGGPAKGPLMYETVVANLIRDRYELRVAGGVGTQSRPDPRSSSHVWISLLSHSFARRPPRSSTGRGMSG